jgi:hypothetical protein
VEIVGHQHASVALDDGQLVGAFEPPLARRRAVVGAPIEDVVLLAVDSGVDRPGRVVVRRRGASWSPRRGVEREAVVGILGGRWRFRAPAGIGKLASGNSSLREARAISRSRILSSAAGVTPSSLSMPRIAAIVSATAAARQSMTVPGPLSLVTAIVPSPLTMVAAYCTGHLSAICSAVHYKVPPCDRSAPERQTNPFHAF